MEIDFREMVLEWGFSIQFTVYSLQKTVFQKRFSVQDKLIPVFRVLGIQSTGNCFSKTDFGLGIS